jgi:hypothetical protein
MNTPIGVAIFATSFQSAMAVECLARKREGVLAKVSFLVSASKQISLDHAASGGIAS